MSCLHRNRAGKKKTDIPEMEFWREETKRHERDNDIEITIKERRLFFSGI
jgi:hypothetical protein